MNIIQSFRFIFGLGAILVGLWLLFLIAGMAFNLEFVNESHEDIFLRFGVFGIPAIILLAFLRNLNEKAKWTEIAGRAAAGLFCAFLCFYIFVLGSLSNMCDYTTGRMLLRSSNNSNNFIAERWFGCGATDSSPASLSFAQLQYITSFLVQVKMVDTSELKLEEWVRLQ